MYVVFSVCVTLLLFDVCLKCMLYSLCVQHCYCLICDNGSLQYLRFGLFEMYVNVVFVIRCLYSTVRLTLVREQRFIRIIYYY